MIFYFGILLLFTHLDERENNDIEVLFDNFFYEYIELRPEMGTFLNPDSEYGVNIQNALFDDNSKRGVDKLYDMYRNYNQLISDFDTAELTRIQRINLKILKWFLDCEIKGQRFVYHPYTLDPMFGFHNRLITLMIEYHNINTVEDAEDYIERLNKYDKKISEIINILNVKKNKGIIPPVFILQRIQDELKDFINSPYSENILIEKFRRVVNNLSNTDKDKKEELEEMANDAVAMKVYPSYSRIISYIDSLKKISDNIAGIWKLPEGDKYYRYCIYKHTTTDMEPEDIHKLGLREVERIQNEIIRLLEGIGISGDYNFSHLMGLYWDRIYSNESIYFYSGTDFSQEQTINDYKSIVYSMEESLSVMFRVKPRMFIKVRRVPKYKEKTSPSYYQIPKLNEKTEGIFYVNLSNRKFKPGMKPLAYHEALPGHHFQIAMERELQSFRLFKTLFYFTGYTEGWALYAEKLAREYGFYRDIHSLIGYLSSELMRAVRLVIDTGIHYKRWSREEAYSYMALNLGWSSYKEIDRYICWPGQACAYKVGELKLLELRDIAGKSLGEDFNIKEFHDCVLEYGSVPLPILEQLINDYIQDSDMD